MQEREPRTQTVKASGARRNWSKLLNKVFRREARLIVENSGVPVAALISAQDFQRFTRLEEERREGFGPLEATW